VNKNDNEKISDEEIIDVEAEDLKTVTEEELEKYINPPADVIKKTASLWQYKPVPDNEPEPYEEYTSSESEHNGFRITGARVRGKKHKHEGTNCDDWFEYETVGDWCIMAVSDGAGSKKFSRIGAMESCRAAIGHIREQLENISVEQVEKLSLPREDALFVEGCSFFASMLQDSVIKARDSVIKAYEERKTKFEYLKLLDRDLEVKDFSGTFLVCMLLPVSVDGEKEYFVVACQIGDGIICSVDNNAEFDKALRLLSEPDNGVYSGETDFLTSESINRKENLMVKTKIMRGKTSAVMLMTDGVADDYFPNSPQLLRLYLDLELNGIFDIPIYKENSEKKLPDNIPEPVSYPWVNDNAKTVAVQYANKISEETGCTLEELWNNRDIINKASLQNFGTELPILRKDRLLRWLDNYTERGSFDDRTLLICKIMEK